MKKFFATVCCLATLLLTSSCATIVSGTTQKIKFNSSPQGAIVSINGNEVGQTPYTTSLKRNKEYQIEITLPGYKPYKATIEKGFNTWAIGNIFLGGFIGLGIDFISGAIYKLDQEDVNAFFSQTGSLASVEGNNIYVTTMLAPLPNAQKIGQLEHI